MTTWSLHLNSVVLSCFMDTCVIRFVRADRLEKRCMQIKCVKIVLICICGSVHNLIAKLQPKEFLIVMEILMDLNSCSIWALSKMHKWIENDHQCTCAIHLFFILSKWDIKGWFSLSLYVRWKKNQNCLT